MTPTLEAMAREAGMTQDGEWWLSTEDGADCDVSTEALTRFAALVRAQALEEAARHFDERDAGAGGFYEPDEPAQIIRALPTSG